MRIELRITQLERHPLHQVFRHGMLELLGNIVHVVPGVAEVRNEIGLDDAMASQHAERPVSSVLREAHAAVRLVFHQPSFGEPLHHATHRGRREVERVGDCRGGGRDATLGQLVDDLEVVLDRSGQVGSDVFSHA